MRPELTGCIQLPTGAVKLELTLATQALIWRCHFSALVFFFSSSSSFSPLSLSLAFCSSSVTSFPGEDKVSQNPTGFPLNFGNVQMQTFQVKKIRVASRFSVRNNPQSPGGHMTLPPFSHFTVEAVMSLLCLIKSGTVSYFVVLKPKTSPYSNRILCVGHKVAYDEEVVTIEDFQHLLQIKI